MGCVCTKVEFCGCNGLNISNLEPLKLDLRNKVFTNEIKFWKQFISDGGCTLSLDFRTGHRHRIRVIFLQGKEGITSPECEGDKQRIEGFPLEPSEYHRHADTLVLDFTAEMKEKRFEVSSNPINSNLLQQP